MKSHCLRVIGFDPTARGFAYAVIDGDEELVDWGSAHVLLCTQARVLSRIEEFLLRTKPDCVAIENCRGTRRGTRAVSLIREIEVLAKRKGMYVVRVSRSHVRSVLAPASTKQEIAEALARVFPELEPRLPRPRKAWDSEDDRMNIFDAVSFAFTALVK